VEALAHALEHGGRRRHQRVDRAALLAGGAVHAIEQGAQRLEDARALVEHRVVARHAVGQLLAQLGDDLGRRARRLGRGLHQAARSRRSSRAPASRPAR
jgi:hypothetical protein